MNKQNILFIVNPISGVRPFVDWKQLLDDYLDHTRFSFSIHETTSRGDATLTSKEAANKGVDVVCAVGGDGTINEVAKGLIDSATTLAIIPRGSGNGLARHFSIPLDPIKAIERINQAATQVIDTGLINGSLFLCLAGIGFDATVAKAFDEFGKRGLLSYAQLALRTYFSYASQRYEIQLAKQTIYTQAFLIAFANASQFGNNAYIAPEADACDGLLDLVIIKPFPWWAAPSVVARIFLGSINLSRYCQRITFDQLTVKSSHHLFHIDGEPAEATDKVQVSVRPKSLKILY